MCEPRVLALGDGPEEETGGERQGGRDFGWKRLGEADRRED